MREIVGNATRNGTPRMTTTSSRSSSLNPDCGLRFTVLTSGGRAISTEVRDPIALRPAVAGGLPLNGDCRPAGGRHTLTLIAAVPTASYAFVAPRPMPFL